MDVRIGDEERCRRYLGVEIDGLHVKEAPYKMQNRIWTVGMRPINALVENFTHDGGQQQVADRGDRHGNGRGEQPPPVGLQIMQHFFHFSTSSNKTSCMCAAP